MIQWVKVDMEPPPKDEWILAVCRHHYVFDHVWLIKYDPEMMAWRNTDREFSPFPLYWARINLPLEVKLGRRS